MNYPKERKIIVYNDTEIIKEEIKMETNEEEYVEVDVDLDVVDIDVDVVVDVE